MNTPDIKKFKAQSIIDAEGNLDSGTRVQVESVEGFGLFVDGVEISAAQDMYGVWHCAIAGADDAIYALNGERTSFYVGELA